MEVEGKSEVGALVWASAANPEELIKAFGERMIDAALREIAKRAPVVVPVPPEVEEGSP